MLTGNLVRVKTTSKGRIVPVYLNRDDPHWLEVAEGLLLIFREGVNMTRGEIESEIDELLGEGMATLANRGLAKVLEDRAEFEVVADLPPETVREKVFLAAAAERRALRAAGHRAPFRREAILEGVARELGLEPERVVAALFADLKDENRMLRFDDLGAQGLIDRYNVALAQAVLLRSVQATLEIRNEKPARYRQLFRQLKFHRLLYQVQGNMREGYVFHIDGPLSLFSATNKYGLQMALFLPTLLLCRDFRLDAELRWGPKREPRVFHLDGGSGLVSHKADTGTYVPAEIGAFLERFRQVAPAWDVTDATDLIELGREGMWVPDYRFVHRETGTDVFVEVLGFWKRSSLERLLRLLPEHGPKRFVLAISERLKVDEEALGELKGPVLRFKEIPNSPELAAILEGFLQRSDDGARIERATMKDDGSREFWVDTFAVDGTAAPQVLLRVAKFTLFALVVTAVHVYENGIDLGLEVGPLEYAGAVLGVLLVLRTNAGYDRWWEGRKLWGGIVNQCRDLAVGALAYGPPDPQWRAAIVRWTAAFAHVARRSLRDERALPEVAALLGDDSARRIAAAEHMPAFMSQRIAELLRQAREQHGMDPFAFLRIDRDRAKLIDHIGGCERIRGAPLPLVYSTHIRRFIVVYLATLPFALLNMVGWETPVIVFLVSYPILALDQIGVELENPFSAQRLGHLPLDELTAKIEKNLLALLDQ